jgi:hypothetical protein
MLADDTARPARAAAPVIKVERHMERSRSAIVELPQNRPRGNADHRRIPFAGQGGSRRRPSDDRQPVAGRSAAKAVKAIDGVCR